MAFIESPTKRSRSNGSACELPQSLRKSKPVCDIASTYKLRAKMGLRTSLSRSPTPSPGKDSGSFCSSQLEASTLASINHATFLIGPDSEAEAENVDLEDDSEDHYDRITWTSANPIMIRNPTTKADEKCEWSCEEVYDTLMAMAFHETSSCDVAVGYIIDLPFSEKTIQTFFKQYLPRYSLIPMKHLKTIFWRARLDIGERHNQNIVAMKREARRSEMIQAHQIYNMKKAEGAKTLEAMHFVCSRINSTNYKNTTMEVEGDRRGSKDSGICVEDDPNPKSQAGPENPYHRTVPIMLRPIDRRIKLSGECSNDGYTVNVRGGVGPEGWSEKRIRSTDLGHNGESEGVIPGYDSTEVFGVQSVATMESGVAQNYSHQNSNASFNQPSHSFPAETVEKGKGKRKQTERTFPAESPPKKFKSDNGKPEGNTRGIATSKKGDRSRTNRSLGLVTWEDSSVVKLFSNVTRNGYTTCAEKQKVNTETHDEELEAEDGDHDAWSAQWNK